MLTGVARGRTLFFVIALACGVLPCHAAQPAVADGYPTRPIRFIVPQPPGGSTDIIARMISTRLAESLRQQVVVDNRPGASGTIGTDIGAKAPPDGHTIVMAYTTHTTSPSLYAKLPYDPIRDFAAITIATSAQIGRAHV